MIDPQDPVVFEETLNLAIDVGGIDFQLDMAQEECAELIVAINHYRRNRATKEDVATEIADVFIVAQKLAKIFGLPLVDQQVKFKMDRLLKRTMEKLKNDLTKK